MTKHRTQSNLSFRLMSLEFRLRDLMRPPVKILEEAGVRPGMAVLDFGCGPGGFSIAAARLVGPEGRVYAIDTHPLATEMLRRAAARKDIENIHATYGSDISWIMDKSVDIALLYDVLHDFTDPVPILAEIHRVLKPNGVLSVSDHHLKNNAQDMVAATGFFLFSGSARQILKFERNNIKG